MVESYVSHRNDVIDNKMQMLAWQTSILINCMGYMKKKVKPTDLYKSKDEQESNDRVKIIGRNKKVELESELLSTFKMNN
ncbi:hypothetical protein UT300009_29260 [Paraclostridium bifermentans]